MRNDTLQLKIKERLNKLDSQDYENFDAWQILEAFNKAQLQWTRAQLAGYNQRGTVDEGSKQFQDDHNRLLHRAPLTAMTRVGTLYYTQDLPADYLAFKRLSASAQTVCCAPRKLRLFACEQANVDVWLADDYHKPNFEWAESFYALAGQRVEIYADDQFEIVDAVLVYYREPRRVQIPGVLDLASGQVATLDVTCEFSDAVAEILADKCAGILAGDTENMQQYQRAAQEVANNS